MTRRTTALRPCLNLVLAAPICAGVAAALLAPAAQAQSQPYYLGVSQSLGHESNLYRIGDQQLLPAGLSKSDTVSSTALFGGIDQAIGRQRVYGSASVRANRYQGNSGLNNEGYGLNLALDWATLERLSGTVSLGASQNLTKFNEINNTGAVETQRNIEQNQQVDAKVSLGVVTRYTAEASAGLRQRRYSAASYARYEQDQTSGSLGLSYRPSNLLALAAAVRITQVDYPRYRDLGSGSFEPDRLKRSDLDFTAAWQPSGSSTVNARLSPTHSSYDRNTESDFSGLTGSASWVWRATGKVRLSTLLSRDTGQSYDALNQGILSTGTVGYSRTTTAMKMAGDYDYSAKIALSAFITQAKRDLGRTFNQGGAAIVERGSDNSTTLGLGAKWSATRSLQVGCDLSADQRRSNNQVLSTTLNANSFSCFGQFVLQ